MRDSQLGYSQSYELLPAKLEEIRSRNKICPNIKGGEKSLLLEMRTEFMMSEGRSIGSERYDMRCSCNAVALSSALRWRLEEYFMSKDGINKLSQELCALGGQLVAEPGHACVAVIVRMDVVTVQREGESLDEAKMRAVLPAKLSPLYVWSEQTVLRRVMNDDHRFTLLLLSISRPQGKDEDDGVCSICLFMRASIGASITELDCGCRFHSHCIIRKLDRDNKCPHCAYQVFDAAYLTPYHNYCPWMWNRDLAQYGVPSLTS